MTVINFFLTRHGETQWNKLGKFQGQLDSPLTEKGYAQAQAIAKYLVHSNITQIVSSTLPRAQNTAESCQLILNCPLSLDSTLIERNFGYWQGKLIDDVKLDNNYQAIFHQVNAIAPPNGESGLDCAKRFQQSLKGIANRYQRNTYDFCHQKSNSTNLEHGSNNVLIVSHGDILRCFLSTMVNNFSDKNAVNTENKAFDNGCIFKLSYDIKEQCFTLQSTFDITTSDSAQTKNSKITPVTVSA